ncbi:hypothetical protein BAU15_09980 [Enterococcus sp. JM4C]|nr:hypothetical protein BAU15_09980 [Enterococcus sp. JM4C]
MIDIDFSKIREHEGSQHNGFEEIVCQIARREKIEGATRFINKDGSGGDGGVEYFWILKDESEVAWQAKYFLNSLGNSEWEQIDKSVKTALKKHPNMKKYYVCAPKDLTDSRKLYKGKPTISELDKWNEYVNKWNSSEEAAGRSIEYVYWGKSELIDKLLSMNDLHKGKIEYWFNSTILTLDSVKEICDSSRVSLGERYSTENNVDLSIEGSFHCIGKDSEWIQEIRETISKFDDAVNEIENLKRNKFSNDFQDELNNIIKLSHTVNTIIRDFDENDEVIFINHEIIVDNLNHLIEKLNNLNSDIYRIETVDKKNKEEIDSLNYEVRTITNKIKDFKEYIESPLFISGKEKNLLITGKAGSGKSHLLCDISIKRLKENLPTLFLLGQHYMGDNPIQFLAKSLGFREMSSLEILSVINTLGETCNSRVLIVIDAINEGQHRDSWNSHLIDFLNQCRKFEFIGVVLSCRDSYLDFIFPEELLKKIPKITHEGFKGKRSEAARKYLINNGISTPNVPFLSQEFTNPLFLKIICQTMKANNETEFPKGLSGFNKTFEYYLDSVMTIVQKKKLIFSQSQIRNAIIEFTEALYPNQLWGISYNDADAIFRNYDNSRGELPLLELLISEGLLAKDYLLNPSGKKSEVIRFTYERFSDYFISIQILEKYSTEDELRNAFAEEGEIGKLLISRYENLGIIQALAIEIPERFSCELIDFVIINEEDYWDKNWYLENTFQSIINSRTIESISDRSLELLNELGGLGYRSDALDILISLSTEPDHPWNAKLLDKNLREKNLPERDSFWSTYVGVSDYEEEDDYLESPIRTILNWVLETSLIDVDSERLYLAGVTLVWLTTTTSRMTRQQATKALSKIFYLIKEKIPEFIKQFSEIDDNYLVSSLYAAIYGAIVKIDNKEIIEKIIDEISWTSVMEGEHPDILLRDYVRGIYEYAYYRKIYTENIEHIRPPYQSTWPLIIPSDTEIDDLDEDHSKIKASVLGFLNDFGKYTMRAVDDWSYTELKSQKVPKSYDDLINEFVGSLDVEIGKEYLEYLSWKKSKSEVNVDQLKQLLKKRNLEDRVLVVEDVVIIDDVPDMDEIYEELNDFEIPLYTDEDIQILFEKVLESLPNEKKEFFKWIHSFSDSARPAKFNDEWARKWIVKRAYELGWSKELFGDFEDRCCNEYNHYPKVKPERIGKKYQWIAYRELLAKFSDNLIFIDRGYSDVDDSKFFGPWQLNLREVDPTFWLKARSAEDKIKNNNSWWMATKYNSFPEFDLSSQKKWLLDKESLPQLVSCFQYVEPETKFEWLSLFEFQSWKLNAITNKKQLAEPTVWYRVNSCIIKREDLKVVERAVKMLGSLQSPDIIYIPDTGSQKYIGEYPWHPSYSDIEDWRIPDRCSEVRGFDYHVPLFEYSWSTGGESYMANEGTQFYMPSKMLIDNLKLLQNQEIPSEWTKNKETVFFDPSLRFNQNSKALIRKDVLCEWLESNDLALIWLIGGEKELFNYRITEYFGRLLYSGFYYMSGDGKIEGGQWSEEERQ